MTTDAKEIEAALSAPFEAGEVKFKAQTARGDRALAVAFVDARVVQDRLDDVLGIMGWQDHYDVLPDGAVVCTLRVRFGSEWVAKMDVGGQSEQPDEGDRRKAAFSDALKRTAVKFGVGRYLYRLPLVWVDYDPQKKQFKRPPQLPAWAIPGKPAEAPAPAEPVGAKLLRRLEEKDATLARVGLGSPGALLALVRGAIRAKGLPHEIEMLSPPWDWVSEMVKDYEAAGLAAMGKPKPANGNGAPKWPQIARDEPGPYVTPEQGTSIIEQLNAAGGNLQQFCDFFSIPNIDRLPVARYDQAIDMLARKKAKATAKAG